MTKPIEVVGNKKMWNLVFFSRLGLGYNSSRATRSVARRRNGTYTREAEEHSSKRSTVNRSCWLFLFLLSREGFIEYFFSFTLLHCSVAFLRVRTSSQNGMVRISLCRTDDLSLRLFFDCLALGITSEGVLNTQQIGLPFFSEVLLAGNDTTSIVC